MDYYILTPLRNKNGGDFVSFILNFTNAYHTDTGTKLLFDSCWNMYQNQVWGVIPDPIKLKLNITIDNYQHFSGLHLSQAIHCVAMMLSLESEDNIHFSLENLIFDSEYDYFCDIT